MFGLRLTGYYHPSLTDDPLHLLSVGRVAADNESSADLEWPRVVITSQPTVMRSVLEDVEGQHSLDSQLDSLEDNFPWLKSAPSPFASKPAMFEAEELVMPGSVAEMQQFQALAQETAKTCVQCYFPELKINLQTRDTFERLYNRVFSDLLMWEPSAPEPCDALSQVMSSVTNDNVHINLASHVGLSGGGGDNFVLCRSAIRDAYDSDSDIDTSSMDRGRLRDVNASTANRSHQSAFCFKLRVNKGAVALFPPAPATTEEDAESANAIEQCGHVVIELDEANFCVVMSFQGNELLDYMNLYATSAAMHHGNLEPRPDNDIVTMETALSTTSLHRTVFPSDSAVRSKLQGDVIGNECGAMLSLALKITKTADSNRNENVLALGIRGGTLSHRVLADGQGWLAQVMDFLSVNDAPVLGYTPPIVVTVLHAHLISCAIDYRPRYLPVSTLITLESFSVSSNIIAGSMTSLLRFIIQDSQVWVAKNRTAYEGLVAVVAMELFELSLRLTDGTDCRQPRVDLNMSSNMLSLRTCSDSCAALLALIKYYAGDGDLETDVSVIEGVQAETTPPTVSDHGNPSDAALSPTVVPEDMVNSLMADAMRESNGDAKFPGDTVTNEIAGESIVGSMTSSDHVTRDLYFQSTLIDYNRDVEKDDSSADEYCILDTEDDTEETEDVEPQVQRLHSAPVRFIENHFAVPLGRYDQLSAPLDFPSAVYKYTLREMSVVWQMYGGRDFAPDSTSATGNLRKHHSAAEKPSPRQQHQRSPRHQDTSRTSRSQGGWNRDLHTMMELHLSKIRFQHEVYPEQAHQSGRDVLLVYDVELRDRCKASKINKFLYRYSSDSIPKQSSANMLTAKVLFTRPEDAVRCEEASVRVALQPMRFNVDQDSLFFLRDFFSDLSSVQWTKEAPSPPGDVALSLLPPPGVDSHYPMGDQDAATSFSVASEAHDGRDQQPAVFIRSFVFSPEVPIRFDYHGKRTELDQRSLPALLMGLAQLSCSELKLKRLHCRSGLLGADRLFQYAIKEWLDDIRRNQIPGILGGVGPTYSLVQLFQGVRDLFLMPVQQYRHDGRWMRGIQRGAHSFSSSTAMAVLELSNRLILAVQAAAETAFDMVSPNINGAPGIPPTRTRAAHQPADLREGVSNAYNVLSVGIANAAGAIAKAATDEHERRGVTGAVGGVLRQIPPTVVQPFILATEATSSVLGGALNQLAPDARREAMEKWKTAE